MAPQGGTAETTYNFDGSESTNKWGPDWAVSTARWNGPRLVVVTRTPNDVQTAVYSMDGDELKIETSVPPFAVSFWYRKVE